MARRKRNRQTTIVVAPFALFGNPGTQAGAELVADALYELLDDNESDERSSRAMAYDKHVRLVELPLDSFEDYHQWQKRAGAIANQALNAGEFLLWIGGNHLSVFPLYEVLAQRDDAIVVQFDAHLDIYHFHDCKSERSHGNYIRELPSHRPPIVNVGHRDLFLPSAEIANHFTAAHSIERLAFDGEAALADVVGRVAKATMRCIDIDWDVLDPAFFPAVVDALPFGMTPQQLLKFVRPMFNEQLAALAVSEFDPGRDDRDRSLQLAIWFLEQVLLWVYEK